MARYKPTAGTSRNPYRWITLAHDTGAGIFEVACALISPVEKEQSRPSATTVCAEHGLPIKRKDWCDDCDGPCPDTLLWYPDNDVMLTVDERKHCALDDDTYVRFHTYLPVDQLDLAVVGLDTWMLTPDPLSQSNYDVLLGVLRSKGWALVGTITMLKTTTDMVVRFSPVTGTLVAHRVIFESQLRQFDMEEVRQLNDREPVPAKYLRAAHEMLASTLASNYDRSRTVDVYGDALRAAIIAKRDGETVPAVTLPNRDQPAGSLISILSKAA